MDESLHMCLNSHGNAWARRGARLAAWGLALVLAVLPLGTARAETAVLQGLDKITARISTFEAPVNQIAEFGSLEITVRRCHKTPPEEPPESAAFMEVVDVRPDSPSVVLFSGWMFASSPAVSALSRRPTWSSRRREQNFAYLKSKLVSRPALLPPTCSLVSARAGCATSPKPPCCSTAGSRRPT